MKQDAYGDLSFTDGRKYEIKHQEEKKQTKISW